MKLWYGLFVSAQYLLISIFVKLGHRVGPLVGRDGLAFLHQSCEVSVPLMTRPDGVRSYCFVSDSGGE